MLYFIQLDSSSGHSISKLDDAPTEHTSRLSDSVIVPDSGLTHDLWSFNWIHFGFYTELEGAEVVVDMSSSVSLSPSLSVCVRQVSGRRSRQVFEAEHVEGVWSVWGEWSQCSQTCGVGVSQRRRTCLPPPPPQTPPLSHSPPNWAGYLPGGIGGPVISPVRPYYPPRYPGQHPSYQSPPASTNQISGLPLYRNTPNEGGGAPVPAQTNPSPPIYQPEFPPNNQEHVSVYRPPYRAPSHGYNQPARVIRRPANPGAARGVGGGSRRSVSTNQEGLPARRWVRPDNWGL